MNQLKMKKIRLNCIFLELNKGNIPQKLKLFMGGDELLNEALKKFGHLNASNCAFLNYLSSSSGQDLL